MSSLPTSMIEHRAATPAAARISIGLAVCRPKMSYPHKKQPKNRCYLSAHRAETNSCYEGAAKAPPFPRHGEHPCVTHTHTRVTRTLLHKTNHTTHTHTYTCISACECPAQLVSVWGLPRGLEKAQERCSARCGLTQHIPGPGQHLPTRRCAPRADQRKVPSPFLSSSERAAPTLTCHPTVPL